MGTRACVMALALVVTAAAPGGSAAPPTDPLVAYQWNLKRLDAEAAWSYTTGAGAVVAVVDSGVDRDHPELAGKLVHGASCIGAATPAQCSRNPAAWDDQNGHGTHVAGIVAAPRDGRGVVGVAPDALVMPVRVLDAGAEGRGSDVATGIRYAVANGADVVNLSVGGLPVVTQLGTRAALKSDLSRALDAAADAGVLVVASAGNDGLPLCNHKIFLTERGVCVGATDQRDLKTAYSDFGGGLDVVAPGGSSLLFCGEEVLSTHLAAHATPCGGGVRGYEALSGTSMAAPHVAGVGALLAQLGLRGTAAAARIAASAVDLGVAGYDVVYGYGRVDARRAVTGDTTARWRPLPP